MSLKIISPLMQRRPWHSPTLSPQQYLFITKEKTGFLSHAFHVSQGNLTNFSGVKYKNGYCFGDWKQTCHLCKSNFQWIRKTEHFCFFLRTYPKPRLPSAQSNDLSVTLPGAQAKQKDLFSWEYYLIIQNGIFQGRS